MTTDQFRDMIRAVRNAGTPLVAIRTADPASARAHVIGALNGAAAETPLVQWDLASGLAGVNDPGVKAAALMAGQNGMFNQVTALSRSTALPKDSILFYLNPQRMLNDPMILQAIWNLREAYKDDGKMLVLLTTPGMILPPELVNDVTILDEPLPSEGQLRGIVTRIFEDAEMPAPDEKTLDSATDALLGLASFPAEQVTAMSLTPKGLDFERMWDRKIQLIEQTPGLRVYRGGETFADVGGNDVLKTFLFRTLTGRRKAKLIVWIDEIEKALAGAGTDLSGVKSGMLGTLLTWMQNHHARGVILVGPPGSGKSLMAKAAGPTVERLTVACDFDGLQSGIVGSSGERLRSVLNVIEAVAGEDSFWIATCNKLDSIPPELRRRFKLGTFYTDLPTAEERAAIWSMYIKKYDLDKVSAREMPQDQGWTGAEIEECCAKAWELGLSVSEAAEFIVPVSISAKDEIESLRQLAHGRFLSASYKGLYKMDQKQPSGTGARRIRQA